MWLFELRGGVETPNPPKGWIERKFTLVDVTCRFGVGEGDLIAYLNVWEAWKGAGEGRASWAHRHCLNHRTLLRAADIRSQLCRRLR